MKIYYDPEFKFDGPRVYSNHLRAERPTHPRYAEIKQLVERLVDSIQKYGIRNPVIVTIIPQHEPEAPRILLHPGQCRCRALRILGRDTVPAIILDKAGTYNGPGKESPELADKVQALLR